MSVTPHLTQNIGQTRALIAQASEQQQIEPGTLSVHADRGSSMTSKPVAMLRSDLGVAKTHSRPYTSTDNPYSEAQFKTLKYRPGFRRGSTRSSTRARSAASSSPGATTSIGTQGSA